MTSTLEGEYVGGKRRQSWLFNLLAVAGCSVQLPAIASGFADLPATQQRWSPNDLRLERKEVEHVFRKSANRRSMMAWDDIIFDAQSAASTLAASSLDKDPSNLLSSIPVMYGAGLLTSVSPCVWGLLPLTMSYISTAAGERKDKATTLPTLAFAAGLAVVFCSLGLVAASVGGAVYGNSGNTNILLPLFSNTICCIMGFQLLELINIPLLNPQPKVDTLTKGDNDVPILINSKGETVNSGSHSKEGGSLFRTFLLGGSSALVASPCATPVLTSILAFVANSSNPILGATLLLFYTVGYSTPLLITAATGGQALIKLRELGSDDSSPYGKLAPWVTPVTAGILLWYGTNGLLTTTSVSYTHLTLPTKA